MDGHLKHNGLAHEKGHVVDGYNYVGESLLLELGVLLTHNWPYVTSLSIEKCLSCSFNIFSIVSHQNH